MKILSPIGKAALRYAAQGLYVMRLVPGTKVPFKGSRGVLDATRDENEIVKMFVDQPFANLAVATGRGTDILDVDGETGVWSLLQLYGEGARRKQLKGPLVRTPSGWHWWIKSIPNMRNRVDFRPRLDFRSLQGYALVPPSVLADGGQYRWSYEGQGPRAAPREAPDWLVAALEGTGEVQPPAKPYTPLVLTDDRLLRLIYRKADEVRQARIGTRNATVNGTAYYLGRRIGASPHYEDIVRRELFAAGMYLSQTAPTSDPFPSREVHSALESGLRAGMARPVVELGIAI